MFGKKCPHEWEKIVETTLPSGYEQMTKGDITFDKMPGAYDIFQKKLVVVLICHKCGAVKTIVESNPGV